MSVGSLFHWFGPDTEKPRRPNLSLLAGGTTRGPIYKISYDKLRKILGQSVT